MHKPIIVFVFVLQLMFTVIALGQDSWHVRTYNPREAKPRVAQQTRLLLKRFGCL